MSDMHAETAMWIDGLRRRADRADTAMSGFPRDHADTVAARDRLAQLRRGLDEAGQLGKHDQGIRADLETMADAIDQAITRALARF